MSSLSEFLLALFLSIVVAITQPLAAAGNTEPPNPSLAPTSKEAPDSAKSHYYKAVELAAAGQTRQAIIEDRLAIALDGNIAAFHILLGALCVEAGSIPQAISIYRSVIVRFPAEAKTDNLVSRIARLEQQSAKRKSLPEQQDPKEAIHASNPNLPVRWPKSRMPLRIAISDGNSIPGYRSEYRQLLIEAFEDWSKASQRRITFTIVPTVEEADVTCIWLHSDTPTIWASAEASDTTVFLSENGISYANIRIATLPSTPLFPLTDARMKRICLSMAGHALGLQDDNEHPSDVLYPHAPLRNTWPELSPRNWNEIISLYSE